MIVLAALACLLLPCLCSSGAEEPKLFDVTGKVFLPDGKPAAGALVRTYWPKDGVRATADASGVYRMKLKPGERYLRASLGGFVTPTFIRFVVGDDGKVKGSTALKLAQGVVLYGRLVDTSTGKPVEGARIIVRDGDETLTDSNGEYRFEALPRGNLTLAAVKDGYYRPIVHVNAADQDLLELPIETRPEGVVKGNVTDENGKPIANVRLGPSGYNFDFESVKTDQNGAYSLRGLDPQGRTEIGAFADGYQWEIERAVVFPAGQREVTIDFQLKSSTKDNRTITGRVTRADGSPAEGVKVSYGWSDSYVGHKTTLTDKDGRYTLKDCDGTKNLVVVQGKGYAPAFRFVDEKVNAQIDFTIEPGHWVEGKIVDESGNPLEGVWISMTAETPEMSKMGFCGDRVYRYLDGRAETDKNGHFRLENLPADKIVVECYDQIHARIDGKPLAVDRKDHVLTMTLPPKVRGTVVDASTGKPITRFSVVQLGTRGTEFNSPKGQFTLSSTFVVGGAMELSIEAAGYCRGHAVLVPKPADKADFRENVIKLEPAGSFGGMVTEAETDKPLEGVTVTVLDTGETGSGWFQWKHIPEVWRPVSKTTDAQGRFSFKELPVKRGSVILEKPGYGKTVVHDMDARKAFKARMARGATVTGVALDESGKPAPRVYVSLSSADHEVQYDSTTTGDDGGFTFPDLPPAKMVVEQHDNNRSVRLHFVDLKPGQNYTVDWNKPGVATLNVTVTRKGQPAGGIHLLVHPVNESMYVAFGDTDAEGKCALNMPRIGDFNVTASVGDYGADDHTDIRVPVSVRRGENSLAIAFPAASVSGVLHDHSGKPVASAIVRAYQKKYERDVYACVSTWRMQHTQPRWWAQKKAKTDASGRFRIDGLNAGAWTLVALKSEDASNGAPGQAFHLNGSDDLSGVSLKMPKLGSAHIAVIDSKTRKPVTVEFMVLRHESGITVYPERDKTCTGGG